MTRRVHTRPAPEKMSGVAHLLGGASGRRVAWLGSAAAVVACLGLLHCGLIEPKPTGGIGGPGGADIPSGEQRIGRFLIRLDGGDPGVARLFVRDLESNRMLLESIRGEAFLGAAAGKEHIKESIGSFFVKDRIQYRCRKQTVESFSGGPQGVSVQGTLACQGGAKPVRYEMQLIPATERRLRFVIRLESKEINRTFLNFASSADERFFGFGEQFTYFDLKGRRVPLLVMEQGVGRGAQPITFGADVTAGSGGDWHTSYAPVPYTITSKLRALYLENYEYSIFDLRHDKSLRVEVFSSEVSGALLTGANPAELVEEYTSFAGRMRALPDWVHSGAVIGMQGGTARVRAAHARLREHHVPLAAFWLQDWEGQRLTKFGKQLWWNWELDNDRYPGWNELNADLAREGIRTMVYINPFLVDASTKKNHRRNLLKEADAKGYLIKDEHGKSMILAHVGFPTALVDLSNPAARLWIKGIIKENLLSVGASGWMADFGEGLPFDARLHAGIPAKYHNQYPEEWAQVNREAIREAGRENDVVFFMRSGYTRSPRHSTLFWLGDQLVSWDKYDGIKTVVTGLISGGLSGYSLNHSDIGGYTTITNPLMNYHRSKELFLRWTELSAFNVVFRTHEGNRPDQNHQFDTDAETLKHFSRFARIYAAWFDYRKQLIAAAAQRGEPVVRPLFYHYPADVRTYSIHNEQFMLGSEFVVAPVLEKGAQEKKLYLPAGRWVNLWDGSVLEGSKDVTVSAPIGKPPVFFREGSEVGAAFRERLKAEGLL